jgi:hypothetical protein
MAQNNKKRQFQQVKTHYCGGFRKRKYKTVLSLWYDTYDLTMIIFLLRKQKKVLNNAETCFLKLI